MTKSVFTGSYEQFRSFLLDARRKAGMTQVQVAKKLKKPQSYVSKYERGERRLDVIEFLEIAGILGVDPTSLMKKIKKSDK